jgi:rare lipoprotein A
MTAASNSLPLGTLVKVTNLKNGNTVIVKINDRMNAKNKRLIDLSFQAAKELDFIKSGTC